MLNESHEGKDIGYGATSVTKPQRGALPPRESEKVVNDFRHDLPARARQWARVHFWLGLVGALAWAGSEAACLLVLDADWKRLVYPVSCSGLDTLLTRRSS